MKKLTLNLVYLLLILGVANLKAQSLVEDASINFANESSNVFNETIKIISNSKKIFILTNNNQQLTPGDFISLAIGDDLAARALVAKIHQGQVGIKILKIYSLNQWAKLQRNLEVQIVKGDDSTYGKPPVVPVEDSDLGKIRSEEDLYTGDVVVEDEIAAFDENKNRHIKPDNIVAFTGAFFEAEEVKSRGGAVRANEFGFSWAFQFTDNYFAEALYGRALIDSFPGDGQQTLVNHLTARLKYNFKGPLYTFFMPYIGFHTYTVSSPDAGTTTNQIANREQEDALAAIKKSGPIFGVTVLRRLVPGWFIKADIGSDIVNVGFAIEF